MKKLIRSKKIERKKEASVKTMLTEKHILFYLAAATTMVAGVLHLAMIGPSLKPINFPMELLPYTNGLFLADQNINSEGIRFRLEVESWKAINLIRL
jgi:hypothetical protein